MIPHSQPMLGQAEIKKVAEVIASGQIAQGEMVAEFETAFAETMGVKDALAVSSGTAALHLVLAAMDIGAGDEVIMPSFVCTALLNAVSYVGAVPVIADIDPISYNIDPADTQKRISDRTRAIIVPHMFGLAADLKALLAFGIPIIEDCAQATGGSYSGRLLGTLGHAAVYSFYATKVMTTGEGGMIITDSRQLYDRMHDLRDYDNRDDYRIRYNYKMTDLQAAVGLEQLERLSDFIDRRRKIAAGYRQSLIDLPVRLPPKSSGHIYFRYVMDVGRDVSAWIAKLKQRGVACARPVYNPLHRYLALKGYPRTDSAWQNSLSIPLFPALTDTQAETVSSVLRNLLKGN